MRINPANSAPVQSTESTATGKSEKLKKSKYDSAVESASDGSKSESTKTHISARAKDMGKAKQIAADTSDVREEKIAALREKIRAGKYDVGAHEIADKLVDDHIRMGGA